MKKLFLLSIAAISLAVSCGNPQTCANSQIDKKTWREIEPKMKSAIAFDWAISEEPFIEFKIKDGTCDPELLTAYDAIIDVLMYSDLEIKEMLRLDKTLRRMEKEGSFISSKCTKEATGMIMDTYKYVFGFKFKFPVYEGLADVRSRFPMLTGLSGQMDVYRVYHKDGYAKKGNLADYYVLYNINGDWRWDTELVCQTE